MSRAFGVFLTTFMASIGMICGAALSLPLRLTPYRPRTVEELPHPHHVPKYRDGVSFRFAMVHDVIHERFPRHGAAYYTERNRRVRETLQSMLSAKSLADPARQMYFDLLDDLGVGLEAIGLRKEATQVMRDKLEQQHVLGFEGRSLYTTYANLGTFLIHDNFGPARQGDLEARHRLREGLKYIRLSIDVNPEAHFGREVWQANAVEYMLSALEDPRILRKYDFIGNRLDAEIDPMTRRCFEDGNMAHYQRRWAADYLKIPRMAGRDKLSQDARMGITTVGAEEGWNKAWLPRAVPFDEPSLGLIGMWRLGGGANPHSAQTLGEIMLRVGQRYIAWCAFERAAILKERYWPDPALQEELVAHCRQRQQLIEQQLPAAERALLRTRFEEELRFGKTYQQQYQEYEAKRIADGLALGDEHFYDEFHATHPQIASLSGDEERFLAEIRPFPRIPVEAMTLFAGLFAFCTAWATTRWTRTPRAVKAEEAASRPL